MMAHIQNLVTRDGTTPFCIGGIVTAIAVHLNWGERIQLLPPLPAVFMDIDNCRAGRLIKVREAGGYYLMVKNARVRSVIMPNHNRTYLGNPDNWLYNLNGPEPGENVQGNQGQANNASADEIEEELEQQEPQQQQANNPATIDAIYAAIMQQNQLSTQRHQSIETRQIEMMTLMQQMQRDQNDYALRHDQSMLEFTTGITADMRALTLRVDDLHNIISQRDGGESSRHGGQARRRARTRG